MAAAVLTASVQPESIPRRIVEALRPALTRGRFTRVRALLRGSITGCGAIFTIAIGYAILALVVGRGWPTLALFATQRGLVQLAQLLLVRLPLALVFLLLLRLLLLPRLLEDKRVCHLSFQRGAKRQIAQQL